MRPSFNVNYFFVFLFFVTLNFKSQTWINDVSIYPFPVKQCDSVTLTIEGNMPSTNCLSNVEYYITLNNITVNVFITCPGIGGPAITPYLETVELGILPSDSFNLVVNQYLENDLQETNISYIDAESCCNAVSNIEVESDSICLGDSVVFENNNTYADSVVWYDNGQIFYPIESDSFYLHTFSSSGIHNILHKVYDSLGCADSSNIELFINDLPDVELFSFPTSCVNCYDGEIIASISSGLQPYIVSWSNGDSTLQIENLGIGIYTLNLTDGNDCSVTENIEVIVSTGKVKKLAEIDLYPNPTSDFFTIRNSISNNIIVNIYDLNGNKLKTMSGSDLSLKNLPKGLYLLSIKDEISNSVFQIIKE